MSVDGADLVAKERYKQKLESVGLLLSDDPSKSHRFSDDMSLWPRIEYGHIFLAISLNNLACIPTGAAAFMEAARSLQFLRVWLCKDCLRKGIRARRPKVHFGQSKQALTRCCT